MTTTKQQCWRWRQRCRQPCQQGRQQGWRWQWQQWRRWRGRQWQWQRQLGLRRRQWWQWLWRQWDNNNTVATTTIKWQRWNNNYVMAMGLFALCHPSKATINLCQQFGEESMRERDNFGGGRTEQGWGGRDWVEITSSPLDQIQINFPRTPEWQTHGILFRMCPGSKAALSTPWWACLMTMKKRNEKCQPVSLLGGGGWPM